MKETEKNYNKENGSIFIKIPKITTFDLLENSVSKYASKIAIIDKGRETTYTELKKNSELLAAILYNKGFQKGDRLALMLANSLEYITVFFAVQRLGGVIVQVNPMYQPQEMEHILKDSGAVWFVGDEKERWKLEKINGLDHLQSIFINESSGKRLSSMLRNETATLPNINIDIDKDVAVLQYTGGTTGFPKGVMLTHSNIVSNIHQMYYHLEKLYKQPDHILLGAAPMFHAMGLTNMVLCLMIGGAYLAVDRFDSRKSLELIRTFKPTLFLGSPTMYIALLNDETLKEDDLKSFKLLVCGSAPMPDEIINRIKQLTNAEFIEGYGLSEATTSTHRNPLEGKRKVGSVGIPVPETEAKIIDVASGKNEIPKGESGELIIKGPQVMKGYWKNQEETKNSIKNGWLYTGDIAVKDEEGYYYIVGRKKDMIIAGGYNIYPAEIENVLYDHPSVQEACVFGVPDSYRGETVKAAIVTKDSLTEDEVTNWCSERLARYKIPKMIEFRDELPKSSVGKILRRKLLEEEYNKKCYDVTGAKPKV